MVKVYKKTDLQFRKKIIKLLSLLIFISGGLIVFYVFFPLISWQIYFASSFASQNLQVPIPKNNVVTSTTIDSFIAQATNIGKDSTNVETWFPTYKSQKKGNTKVAFYKISIPKIKIKDAVVSAVDTNLTKNLVNYGGTAVPPQKGNSVIFGHSTLPQLYNEKDYKTVFTNLYKLAPGDQIVVSLNNQTYKYKVQKVTVVDPDNTTVLEQTYDESYITLITCTPPGTIWKRLVVKAKMEKI